MKTELEPKDIERLADKVIERLIPIVQSRVQKLSFSHISDPGNERKEKVVIKREGRRRMLSVRESAGYMGIAEKTLRNRLGSKAQYPFPVKPKHIGGKVLFDVKDLDAYLDTLPTT